MSTADYLKTLHAELVLAIAAALRHDTEGGRNGS